MPTQSYNIYKLSDGKHAYVGMTTQSLSARLAQHKKDAGAGGTCSLTKKLCKKKLPTDVAALYRRLRDHPEKFSISSLKSVKGTYASAHKVEQALKRQHSKM